MELIRKHLSRTQAAGIHLLVSICIALIVVCAMIFVWYPSPYFNAMGGGLLLALMVGCDVVIGPLITFIIWNPGKKSLKFDVTVIALIQLAALAYGAFVMFEARPIYTVFYRDRFDVVIAARVYDEELARAAGTPYNSRPLTGPKLVALNMPTDIQERNRMSFHSPSSGDYVAFPQYFVPYEERATEAGANAKPLAELKAKNPQIVAELGALLIEKGVAESAAGYWPLNTKSSDMAVIVDKKSGKILGMIFANPW
jgi:hypothetical protein